MTLAKLRQLIVPTAAQALGFPVVTLLVFVIIFNADLSRRFFPSVVFDPSVQRPDYANQFLARLDTPVIHSVVIVVFWSIIGLLAYTLVWGLSNAFIEARNEVVIETEYVNKGTLRQRSRAVAWQVAWAAVTFAAFLVTAYLLAPLWVTMFGQFVFAHFDAYSFGLIAGSVFGAAFNGYVLWLLILAALGRAT